MPNPMNMMKEKLDMGKYVMSGKPWSEVKFFDQIMMDALMKYVFGLVYCRMADFGEVMDAIGHMHSADEDGWADAWIAAGKRLEKRAASAEERKKLYSAGEEYLRASSYYRIGLMYFSKPEDHRMKEYARRSHGCYEKYLKLSGYPGEYVRIPYEGTYLPGHFYRSPSAGEKTPLLILTPGRDTWGEDTRWVYDAALKRGIHCLVYDGPGQGFALRLQGLPFRPDWENVVTPVVDFACTLPGIDTDRIGIMGISFGGFLIPRAVAFEKRIKLCITDPGSLDWGSGISENLGKMGKMPKFMIPDSVATMIADYAWKQGVGNDVDAVVQELKKYNNTDIIDKITCKMLVLDGTAEITYGEAKKLYDALKCPKEYLLFDEETTAQCHSQMGGYGIASEVLADWLEENL